MTLVCRTRVVNGNPIECQRPIACFENGADAFTSVRHLTENNKWSYRGNDIIEITKDDIVDTYYLIPITCYKGPIRL